MDPDYHLQLVLYQELNIKLADLLNDLQGDASAADSSGPPMVGGDSSTSASKMNQTRVKSMEAKCRHWLGARVRLLAEALSEDSTRSGNQARSQRGPQRRAPVQDSSKSAQINKAAASSEQMKPPQHGRVNVTAMPLTKLVDLSTRNLQALLGI